jgi:rieske iron-sulfur protein
MVEQSPHPETTNGRRRFLKWLIRLGYGAFALAFALPALALRTLTSEAQTVAAGDQLVYATGDQAGSPLSIDDVPAGSAVQAFPAGKSDNQNTLIQLVGLPGSPEPTVVAYSAICTHLGCSVLAQLDDDGNIVCPCHGSVFDPADGAAVVRGPAGRPLPGLPISVESDGAIAAAGTFDGPVGPQ